MGRPTDLANSGKHFSLRRRLALTTILSFAPFSGYGRLAYADCVAPPSSANYTCSGTTIGPQNITTPDAVVTTTADFELTSPANGVNIEALGDLQFIDNEFSSITTTAGAGVRVHSTGNSINAGAVTIETNGTITGGLIGVWAINEGTGDIDVTVDGDVTGTSNDGVNIANGLTGRDVRVTTGADSVILGGDFGIYVNNYGIGDTEITVNNMVTGTTEDGLYGWTNDTAGNLTITAAASGTVTGGKNGIFAYGRGRGDVEISTYGRITGNIEDGIDAFNSKNGANLTVTVHADSLVSGGTHGVEARNYGAGNLAITVNGAITANSDGIHARNVYGEYYNPDTHEDYFGRAVDLTITTGAGSVITGFDHGIYAYNFGGGGVDIAVEGEVGARTLDGIKAYNSAAGTDLTITTGAGSAVSGGDDGMQVTNYGAGNLDINVNGSVIGENGIGISAINSYGYVYDPGDPQGPPIGKNLGIDLTITTSAASVVTGAGQGILANNQGTGNLEIDIYGEVTGGDADGIDARNGEYSDDLTITTGAASAVTGAEDGIEARNFGTGYLKITTDGAVTGEVQDGIEAINSSNGTDLEITIGEESAVTGSDGIDAVNQGSGHLAITVRGALTGHNGSGLEADNDNGTDLTITTYAGSQVRGAEYGIDADSDGSGNLKITVNGAVAGTTLSGIYADNGGGGYTSVIIGATGLAEGNVAGIDAHSGDGQAIGITNDGIVRNLSGESNDLAVTAVGGAATITNNGRLTGTVALDRFGDTLNNAGLWNAANGTSDFGANYGSVDVVNNTGTLIAADDKATTEHTVLENLETFNNAGLVSLFDGREGDVLTMRWNFDGQGGSVLGVDAFLAPGGTSDRLVIGLNTSGVTHVAVNLTNPIGSAPNFDGIAVVEVTEITADGHFDVEGGVLNAGFFAWDMRLDEDGHTHELYTTGFGVGAYEFAAGISGAQEMWHQTNGTVLQRQADLRALLEGMGVTPVADYAEPVAPTPVGRIAPGFWFRGVGAYIEQDDEENGFTLDREQTIWGGMAGFDSGTQDIGDALLFGMFAGYLTSDLEFDETNTEWTYEGPTVGVYATYLDHAFYVDATVKADFLSIDIDPEDLAPAADDADTDAVNIGGRIDTGYKFGETYFIEPQATLAIVHTEIDDVDIFGGTVEFDDATSVRGRLGVRLGYEETVSSGVTYSGDVTASVWEDFSDDNQVTIADTGIPDFGASDDAGGTIGDVALGFSVLAPDGWSGFLRGNYLFGNDYEAVTGSAGLRYAF